MKHFLAIITFDYYRMLSEGFRIFGPCCLSSSYPIMNTERPETPELPNLLIS